MAAVADLRGRDRLRPRAWSLRPRSQDSAHSPVHPSVPPLPPSRKATRREPRVPSDADTLCDLECGPPPPSRPQFPRLSNEGDLTDMVRGGPELTSSCDGRGGRTPGPLPPAATARATSPGGRVLPLPARSHGRWPGLRARAKPGPRATARRRVAWGGQGQPTHMAGVAGAGLGSDRDGGSRWLRLALATGRWRLHVTHIRALRAGVGRSGDWSGARPRGRGAAGGGRASGAASLAPRSLPHLPQPDFCGFRTPTASLPVSAEPAQPPPRLCHFLIMAPLIHKPRSPSYRETSKPVWTPHSPRSHTAPSFQCLVTHR